MVKKGWVERQFLGAKWGEPKIIPGRSSCRYRITVAGAKALAAHLALARAARSKADADSAADKAAR